MMEMLIFLWDVIFLFQEGSKLIQTNIACNILISWGMFWIVRNSLIFSITPKLYDIQQQMEKEAQQLYWI